jgi:hypothetical protein
MATNYLAVFACGVLSIVLGSIWYGPLFGKKYMELFMPKNMTPEQSAMMKKQAKVLYFIQFLISLAQVYFLSFYISVWPSITGAGNAFIVYLGFVFTTTAGSVLWTGDSKKVMWQKFIIQAGYQLVFFVLAGHILSIWK